MKNYVYIFGLVIGAILCVMMFILVNMFYNNPDFKGNELVGYASMIVIFSLIFFGVRNYRNKHLGGYISFGRAFKTGLLIALVGSTMYVVAWLFYYYLFVPDFLDRYIDFVLKETPASKIPEKTAEMEKFRELYRNPLFVILFTYAEVLPVGLVVTLLSALFLWRRRRSIAAT